MCQNMPGSVYVMKFCGLHGPLLQQFLANNKPHTGHGRYFCRIEPKNTIFSTLLTNTNV